MQEARRGFIDVYLRRRIAGVTPGRLKQPRGMIIRWLPCAGLEPPWAMRVLRCAAYPSVNGVASG